MQTNIIPWKFPANVSLEQVTIYIKQLERMPAGKLYTFDLSKTKYIHSSFIGFLISAKQKLDAVEGTLLLLISDSIEKILRMLKIADFFPYRILEDTQSDCLLKDEHDEYNADKIHITLW